MSSFNIRQTEITIEADGSGFVEVGFLPFNLGQHQCTVIFVNETIGEFLYAVHATTTLPLAAHVPYTPGGARISNSAAAGRTIYNLDDISSQLLHPTITHTATSLFVGNIWVTTTDHNCRFSKENATQT